MVGGKITSTCFESMSCCFSNAAIFGLREVVQGAFTIARAVVHLAGGAFSHPADDDSTVGSPGLPPQRQRPVAGKPAKESAMRQQHFRFMRIVKTLLSEAPLFGAPGDAVGYSEPDESARVTPNTVQSQKKWGFRGAQFCIV